jgi:RimJ/RimL family protein N-acetyltransferase
MQLVVRDTTLDDVPNLADICRHPLVRPHQFKLAPNLEDGFRHLLSVDRFHGGMEHRFSSIDCDQRLVGYITHGHYRFRGHGVARLGWNLDPEYWGRGIMSAALSILFDRCASEHETQFYIADCFRQNTRCKRVLAKLGFVPVRMPWFERIVTALSQECLHWIERFQFDCANRP